MYRREILKAGAVLAGTSILPKLASAGGNAVFDPQPSGWRSFEITTTLSPARADTEVRAWVPLAGFRADEWNRPRGNRWTTNARVARVERDAAGGAEMLYLEWQAGEAQPAAEIVNLVDTRNRATDFSRRPEIVPLTQAERDKYLAGTKLAPVGGLVKETSDAIVAGVDGDLERAKRIYDWVVERTYRRASTRGCGEGDVVAMLESGDLGGKCADLNPLYVALVRAAGIPARDLYGVRVIPSAFGYRSLGAKDQTITKAQHCRAEIYLDGFGWIATDPADVRKVMLEEEKGGLSLDDPRVNVVRQRLFGAWEGNWIAYNDASDVALPGSGGETLGFLMYPQAEVATARLDCLDPDKFRYAITAREVTI